MKRLAGYPGWFYWVLLSALGVVFITGCLMIPTMLEFKLAMDVPWRLEGNGRLWSVSLHTVLAWFLMMATGALWQVHMRAGWRKRENRLSGILLALILLILTLTGIGLYYLSSLEAQNTSAIVHTVTGLALLFLTLWHMLRGRQYRKHQRIR